MKMDGAELSKDLLGRTYEYCIAQFAAYEGAKGGEFYTPSSIVKTIVAILKPFNNCRVYEIKTRYLIQFNTAKSRRVGLKPAYFLPLKNSNIITGYYNKRY